jgi:indolepyruvate ferredoxin oxidoreductase, beta subunit
MATTTVLLCGVGGQGTILAADILAKTAAASGMDVKISEIHGMSQRGGSVTTTVRFGDSVASPVTDLGYTDRIVAFERTEALRNLPYLSKDGLMLVNDEEIIPLPVLIGQASMPEDSAKTLKDLGAKLLDAKQIALSVGNPKATNVVLMGALSKELPFAEETWIEVITKRVPPKTLEANLAAFKAGREAV